MLINCLAYQEGQKPADIAVSEIGAYPDRPGCVVITAQHGFLFRRKRVGRLQD